MSADLSTALTTPQRYMEERWFDLLTAAVAAHERGIAGVAEVLDIARPTLSMVLRGSYPASVQRVAKRVLESYDRHDCPHLAAPVSQIYCASVALTPAPINSARTMGHWRACQACPHLPRRAA